MRSQSPRRRKHRRTSRERREEQRLRAYTLLSDELDLPSLSGMLIVFADPLRALLPPQLERASYEALLRAAALVWNAALAFEGERLARELALAAERLAEATGAEPSQVRPSVLHLARQRRTQLGQEPRFIADVEVVDEGGEDLRVLVRSHQLPTHPQPEGERFIV